MTKEVLLQRLNEIYLGLNYENQEEGQLEDSRKLLELKIRQLEIKIADDANYTVFTLFRSHDNITSQLNKIGINLLRNESAITENSQRINYINSEIEAYYAILSEEQKKLEQYKTELKKLNESDSKRKQILNLIEQTNEKIKNLELDFALLSVELNGLNLIKENLLEQKRLLEDSQKRCNDLLNSAKENCEKSAIDTAKKEKDQTKLFQLKDLLLVVGNRENFVYFELPLKLKNLIDDVKNNRVDIDGVLGVFQEIKMALPKLVTNKNYKSISQEVEAILHLEERLKAKRKRISSKLSEPTNYLPSIMDVKTWIQEISDLKQTIAKYEIDISNCKFEIDRNNSLKEEYELDIKHTKKEKNRFERLLYSLQERKMFLSSDIYSEENDVVAKEIKRIQKEIDKRDDEIGRLNQTISSLEASTLQIKYVKKSLEGLKKGVIKSLEEKKKQYNNRKIIDEMAMLNDYQELALLDAQLFILNVRLQSISYEEKISELINDLNTKDNKNISFELSTEQNDDSTLIVTWALPNETVLNKIHSNGDTIKAVTNITLVSLLANSSQFFSPAKRLEYYKKGEGIK